MRAQVRIYIDGILTAAMEIAALVLIKTDTAWDFNIVLERHHHRSTIT